MWLATGSAKVATRQRRTLRPEGMNVRVAMVSRPPLAEPQLLLIYRLTSCKRVRKTRANAKRLNVLERVGYYSENHGSILFISLYMPNGSTIEYRRGFMRPQKRD